jgi:hypothetical protein
VPLAKAYNQHKKDQAQKVRKTKNVRKTKSHPTLIPIEP